MAAQRSIATLIAVSLVVTVNAVLLAFAALYLWQEYGRARAGLQRSTATLAAQLAISLQSPAWNFDRPQIEGLIDSAMQAPDVYALWVQLDSNTTYGRVRDAQWHSIPAGAPPAQADLFQARERIVNPSPARAGFGAGAGASLGTVTVYESFRVQRQQLERALLFTLAAILVADLLLIAMLYLLAWMLVLRPLKTLRAHAAAVAGGADEVAGLQATHFRGEFEDLRASLAVTLEQLRNRYQDLQRQQQRYRALVGDMQRLQDSERRRLGRELHDSTGQVLAALEINLSRLQKRSVDPDPETRRLLDQSLDLAKQSLGEIRTASYLLHPPLLDEMGLATALRWLADGFRERSDIRLHVMVPDRMERLPAELELALFRVAQEALTNVHRHSGARSAEIRLYSDAESVTLCVSDTGRGMSGAGAGVGLAAMRERMQQVGGEFTVTSVDGGTSVCASRRLDAGGPAQG